MENKKDIRKWLRKHSGWVAFISLVFILLVILIVWKVTSNGWAGLLAILIPLINIIPISDFLKAFVEVIKMTPKQAALDQLERESRIERLIELDEAQKSDIKLYLKTYIESVSYKTGLDSTAPYVDIKIRFANLLTIPIEIVGCRLYTERLDSSQLNCLGKSCQFIPQEIQISDNDKDMKSVSINGVDLRIFVPSIVAQYIKECSKDKTSIQYTIRIEWKLQGEYLNDYLFKDYLQYQEVPNAAV